MEGDRLRLGRLELRLSKAARRAAKKERRAEGRIDRQQWPTIPAHERAHEWEHVPKEHLELTCRTLDRLVGLRNRVIGDLGEHLTDEHRRMLSFPNLPADQRARLELIE